MKITCCLQVKYADEKVAHAVSHSLQVDDVSFVKSSITNKCLQVNITASTISSLIQSLDDYLACLSIAEKIVNKN